MLSCNFRYVSSFKKCWVVLHCFWLFAITSLFLWMQTWTKHFLHNDEKKKEKKEARSTLRIQTKPTYNVIEHVCSSKCSHHTWLLCPRVSSLSCHCENLLNLTSIWVKDMIHITYHIHQDKLFSASSIPLLQNLWEFYLHYKWRLHTISSQWS